MKRFFVLAVALWAAPVFGVETAPPEPAPAPAMKIDQAAALLTRSSQILDLRPKAEWDKSHLPYSKQLSLADENFSEKVKAMFDPAKPLLVYCRSGRCSGKAAKQLRDAGFAKVDDLEGGIEAWTAAGRPVER